MLSGLKTLKYTSLFTITLASPHTYFILGNIPRVKSDAYSLERPI